MVTWLWLAAVIFPMLFPLCFSRLMWGPHRADLSISAPDLWSLGGEETILLLLNLSWFPDILAICWLYHFQCIIKLRFCSNQVTVYNYIRSVSESWFNKIRSSRYIRHLNLIWAVLWTIWAQHPFQTVLLWISRVWSANKCLVSIDLWILAYSTVDI